MSDSSVRRRKFEAAEDSSSSSGHAPKPSHAREKHGTDRAAGGGKGRPSFVSEARVDLRQALAELDQAQKALAELDPALVGHRRRAAETEALRHIDIARRFVREVLLRSR